MSTRAQIEEQRRRLVATTLTIAALETDPKVHRKGEQILAELIYVRLASGCKRTVSTDNLTWCPPFDEDN